MQGFGVELRHLTRASGTDPAESRLILTPQKKPEPDADASTFVGKLQHAAKWALDIDAHYRTLLQTGRSLKILVPSTSERGVERVGREAVSDYRRLRLRVGELIHPLLLDPPDLEYLYPFQRRGVEWLVEREGGILADDMGLGKTAQAISAMRVLFNSGNIRSALVVCPKGLIAIWEQELGRWAPELGVAVLTPSAKVREEAWEVLVERRHVLLTNYEQLRVPPDALLRSTPDLIIADEAHRLRNKDSKVGSSGIRLSPKRFWALTGTPLERDLEDMATLLSIVAPKVFAPSDADQHLSSLRSRARPYILRRRKQEVLDELPAVLDTTEMLDLSDAQRRAYQRAIRKYHKTNKAGEELALLTRLLALCDIDPESRESSKIERTLSLLARINEQNEKAVIFSNRLEPLREIKNRIDNKWGANKAALLVGEMGRKERSDAIKRFQGEEQVLALLVSSRVGGEGLTLVEANHVFLFNEWWNPSANNQARDRVVRIGQKRKVHVYRFCCRGTVEESLKRILASKQKLFDLTVERLSKGQDSAWTQILHEVKMNDLLETSG